MMIWFKLRGVGKTRFMPQGRIMTMKLYLYIRAWSHLGCGGRVRTLRMFLGKSKRKLRIRLSQNMNAKTQTESSSITLAIITKCSRESASKYNSLGMRLMGLLWMTSCFMMRVVLRVRMLFCSSRLSSTTMRSRKVSVWRCEIVKILTWFWRIQGTIWGLTSLFSFFLSLICVVGAIFTMMRMLYYYIFFFERDGEPT